MKLSKKKIRMFADLNPVVDAMPPPGHPRNHSQRSKFGRKQMRQEMKLAEQQAEESSIAEELYWEEQRNWSYYEDFYPRSYGDDYMDDEDPELIELQEAESVFRCYEDEWEADNNENEYNEWEKHYGKSLDPNYEQTDYPYPDWDQDDYY